jgi:hypothetical protein
MSISVRIRPERVLRRKQGNFVLLFHPGAGFASLTFDHRSQLGIGPDQYARFAALDALNDDLPGHLGRQLQRLVRHCATTSDLLGRRFFRSASVLGGRRGDAFRVHDGDPDPGSLDLMPQRLGKAPHGELAGRVRCLPRWRNDTVERLKQRASQIRDARSPSCRRPPSRTAGPPCRARSSGAASTASSSLAWAGSRSPFGHNPRSSPTPVPR